VFLVSSMPSKLLAPSRCLHLEPLAHHDRFSFKLASESCVFEPVLVSIIFRGCFQRG
jgi:hypothetical protein